MDISIVLEMLLILITLIFTTYYVKKDSKKSRKVYAIAFVIALALCIPFSIIQILSVFDIVEINMTYNPIEIMSILSVIYWISFAFKDSNFWDKVTG